MKHIGAWGMFNRLMLSQETTSYEVLYIGTDMSRLQPPPYPVPAQGVSWQEVILRRRVLACALTLAISNVIPDFVLHMKARLKRESAAFLAELVMPSREKLCGVRPGKVPGAAALCSYVHCRRLNIDRVKTGQAVQQPHVLPDTAEASEGGLPRLTGRFRYITCAIEASMWCFGKHGKNWEALIQWHFRSNIQRCPELSPCRPPHTRASP